MVLIVCRIEAKKSPVTMWLPGLVGQSLSET